MSKIYVVGSLRRDDVRKVAEELRAEGHDVFDEWHAAGPEADNLWRDYFKGRGMRFSEALRSAFVEHIVEFDKRWLDWAEVVVVLGPAGVSSAIELMYCAFNGKRPILYQPADPERWDAMLLLIPGLELFNELEAVCQALHAPVLHNIRPPLSVPNGGVGGWPNWVLKDDNALGDYHTHPWSVLDHDPLCLLCNSRSPGGSHSPDS